MANLGFARFTSQAEMFFYFYEIIDTAEFMKVKEEFQSQAEIVLYFGPSKLGLENLAILHTRSVNFVVANPKDCTFHNSSLDSFLFLRANPNHKVQKDIGVSISS